MIHGMKIGKGGIFPREIYPVKLESFFARRITFKNHRSVTNLVVRLAVLSIAVAIATIEIAFSFVQGFENEIKKKVVGFGSHVQIGNYFRTSNAEMVPLPKNDPSIQKIRTLDNVLSVSPYVQRWGLLRSKAGQAGVALKGVDSGYEWAFFESNMKEGRLPVFPDSVEESGEVLISRKTANSLDLKPGDKARAFFIDDPIRRRPIVVAGIYETGMEEFDNLVVICDMRMLQQIQGWTSNQVTGFEVNLGSIEPQCQWVLGEKFPFIEKNCPDPIQLAASRINDETPYLFGAAPINELYPEIFDWLYLQRQNVWFIMTLMIIVAVINMTSVVLILILERTRTVGLLRALGMAKGGLRRIFVINAFYLIGIGAVAGNVLGLGLLASQDIFGWLRVSQESYFIEVVPVAWVWEEFLFVNLSLIAICTLFMFLPSVVVNSIRPVKALRFD